MSILIKGMEMPGGCIKCPFLRWVDYDCMAATELKENGFCNVRSELNIKRTLDYIDTRHPKCPLVEVPTPHGRLIDAYTYEDILKSLGSRSYRREKGTIMDAIKILNEEYTPTVIEAEE